tara:strand:- start:943 stop:1164 length:222 start_codon:yes stop_codon:yes gene_type:complete
MVIRIPGTKEQVNLDKLQRKLKMPRGQITRYEIQSRLFKIKDELRGENAPSEYKFLADQYLNKVLDYVEQFRY